MKQTRNKFSRHSGGKRKKPIRTNQSAQDLSQLQKPCGCGSGKSFDKCCFRPDHRRFNLESYFEKLKGIKLKLLDRALLQLVEVYEENENIRQMADSLSKELKIPNYRQVFLEIYNNIEHVETQTELIASAVQLEHLTIDVTLPGHDKPLFQEKEQIILMKSSERVRECYDSLKNSQYSLYEVIKVKKKDNDGPNSVVILRDLFTERKYLFKSPKICPQLHIWDVIIGRLYTINGFHLFSTGLYLLSPDQQKIFNRALFMFWAKNAHEREGTSFFKRLYEKYPSIKSEFSHKISAFNGPYLFNDEIRAYLKENSPALVKIMQIIRQISPLYSPIIASPDQNDFCWAESEGEVPPEHVDKVINTLRAYKKNFIRNKVTGYGDKITFDYYAPRKSPSDHSYETSIIPEKIIFLNEKPMTGQIMELCRRRLIINYQPVDIRLPDEDLAEIMLRNADGDYNVRIGFIEISGNYLRFVTYSRESMEKLWDDFIKIMGPYEIALAPPTFSDYPGMVHHDAFTPNYDELTPSEIADLMEEEGSILEDLVPYPEFTDHYPEEFERSQLDEELEDKSRSVRIQSKKKWIYQKLPFLGEKSPAELVVSKEITPLLLDLIKEMENRDDRDGEYKQKETYSKLLGIDIMRNFRRNSGKQE